VKQVANFWAERRKSAGEQLQSRKSMESTRRPNLSQQSSFELSRPGSTRPSTEHLRQDYGKVASKAVSARSSVESINSRASREHRRQTVDFNGRSSSARPSAEFQNPSNLHSYKSFDSNQQQNYQESQKAWASRRQSQPFKQPQRHETYSSYGKRTDRQEAKEEQYYEAPGFHSDFHAQERLMMQQKARSSDILVLDRYSSGLGYGDFGGSVRTRTVGGVERKSVPAETDYGLDFSDVPVMLQRVKVRS